MRRCPRAGTDAVVRFVSKKHDASQVVGYGKVAFIFHMLKQEVGPDRFDQAMKRFWSDHKFTVAGWSDIRAAFEHVAKSDLGWFFGQWTERAGAPRVILKDAQTSSGDNGHVLEVSLAQDAPAYRLSVPVEVTTEAGTRRFAIRLDGADVTERLQLEAKPVSLRIDPDHGLFRHLLPGEAPPILRDVLLDGGRQDLCAAGRSARPRGRTRPGGPHVRRRTDLPERRNGPAAGRAVSGVRNR